MHSMPSYRVSTTGYLLASPVNFSVAPADTWRFTLLSRAIAPVRYVPGGTLTMPPPALLAAVMAALNAAVLSVEPSFFAPYLVTSKTVLGKVGTFVAATIVFASGHGR